LELKDAVMYDTIKIVDLNPSVPEDQIYDLLCEKFSDFPNAKVNIVQQDEGREAYIHFTNYKDASVAMQENSCIVLFGYACRAVPVYDRPGGRRSPDGEYLQTANEYPSDAFRRSEDHEQAGASPDEHTAKDSPTRQSGGFRGGRSFRGTRWLNYRGGRWQRARGRGGRPYQFTSGQVRGRGRPYLLTKSRDNDEQKPHVPLETGDDDRKEPHLSTAASETSGELEEKDPNSTLYIGSMDPVVKEIDLKRLFGSFGYVLSVEIKNPNAAASFAFVHFLTMDMARLAKQEMEGKPIGRTVPKFGYGRNVATKCLWVGGLGPWTSEDMLRFEFGQFGKVEKVDWPKNRDYAFVVFHSVQDATDAKQVMHGSHHGDPPHRLRICYASSVQMSSFLNKKEFPKFPKKRIVPMTAKTDFLEKRKSQDWEFQESRRRRRRSPEIRRSHSRHRRSSSERRSRFRHRKSHSHIRSKRKERKSPSPYARSISQASSDMSAISETSSESIGSPERNKPRKRRQKLSVSRSPPVNKLLRNPSPPKSVMKDERTVVLRSEPQPVAGVSGATSNVFTSVRNPLDTTAVPTYIPSVEPVVYYPPVASSLPPPMYPTPVHIPPPDYYVPPNPMMPPPFQQHLPPLASYPPIPAANTQAVAVTSVQNPYLADYLHQATTPAKEIKKSAGIATKFPKVWSGALVLRNAAFVVDFHLLSGSVLVVNSLLGSNVEPGSESDCPVLKISQRLRVDQQDKLDELDRRLKKAGRTGCSVLLATSTPAQVDDDANVVQQYPLSSLVSYLLQKQVAAVVSLPPGSLDAAKATGVLHAFPPCKFATDFLQREAPELPTSCPTEEELLVVLCKF